MNGTRLLPVRSKDCGELDWGTQKKIGQSSAARPRRVLHFVLQRTNKPLLRLEVQLGPPEPQGINEYLHPYILHHQVIHSHDDIHLTRERLKESKRHGLHLRVCVSSCSPHTTHSSEGMNSINIPACTAQNSYRTLSHMVQPWF